ncbi:hypothetical protein JZ751_014209 [Albula glossodonta]|uniref:Uncharacterized protein n=1 Tax=Albula glossodonta TaxID=121402 RepID=A0A8T2NVE6_9TELE|nr:hypothetical protein JZ751_014209 [Albula glossodonta]
MKKFFDDIKKEFKFKSAGPGKKLTGDSSSKAPVVQNSGHAKPRQVPTEGAQRAGAAALARIEQQQHPRPHSSHSAIRNQAKDLACLSVSGVYFICPLTGATITKNEKEAHIKEAILKRLVEDPLEASIMMIHTFNKDQEKVKAGVDIISKLVRGDFMLGFRPEVGPQVGRV